LMCEKIAFFDMKRIVQDLDRQINLASYR